MKAPPPTRPFHSSAGFSRRELMVTMSCLVLLFLVASTWYNRWRDLPARKVCQQNLQQLVVGFNSYEAAAGRYPAAARTGVVAMDDWIFWQQKRLLTESALNHTTNFLGLLRCPADRKYSSRAYSYSYSMNVNFERTKTRDIPHHAPFILLYEEEVPNDGACAVGVESDALAKRHGRRSNAGFIDGHVELISRSTGEARADARRR